MTLVAPWRKVTCPFCFQRFHLADTQRRLTSHAGKPEKDVYIARFLSVDDKAAPDLGPLIPAANGAFGQLLGRCFVSGDWRGNTKKICPGCHMFLPNATANGQLSSDIVAVWGARSSGKSNFFGVLLNALERRYADELGFTIFDQESFTTNGMRPVSSKHVYRERYGQYLFNANERKAVGQTHSAQTNTSARIPLIYRLEFPMRPLDRFRRPFSRVKAMDLVLFDAAGEDMGDATMLDQFYRYVLSASGVIFVLDPFQFPGIRSQLSEDLKKRYEAIEVEPAEVVARVITLFETRGGLRAGAKIRVPVAFAFSKADGLKHFVHPSSQMLRDSRHQGGFNLADCRRVSEEVMEYLREWDDSQLLNLVRRKFRQYSFFALSALGQLPAEDLSIEPVAPRRVADPLLWLLWKQGYLPATEG